MKMKRTVWCCPEGQTATVVQKHCYKLMHSCCVKKKLPLESLGSLYWGMMGWKEGWRFMSSPALLLVRLPSPAANCPTREQGSDPVLHRPYVLHKHPLPPLSSSPPLCCRPLSPSDGWQGLLWRRLVGTLMVLVSKLKLCLRERLQHPG